MSERNAAHTRHLRRFTPRPRLREEFKWVAPGRERAGILVRVGPDQAKSRTLRKGIVN